MIQHRNPLENIPAELRILENWGCHHDKRPFNPLLIGRYASSTDAATRASFSEALAAYRRGGYHGLVYAITPPHVGADYDHCVDPDTGVIDPWVAGWLARLDSYSEYSPSETGIHVWVRATLASAVKTSRCELYGRERFFTMTGNRVPGTPATIEERQDVVDALVAELRPQPTGGTADLPVWSQAPVGPPAGLRERAAAGRIRRTTLALLDSTGPAGYGSASEADSAIAAGLVGAGLTADEVLALLRESARGADLLTRKGARHGEYCLRRVVERAAAHVGPVLAAPGGLRVRVGNGAATAWRLAGRAHGGHS